MEGLNQTSHKHRGDYFPSLKRETSRAGESRRGIRADLRGEPGIRRANEFLRTLAAGPETRPCLCEPPPDKAERHRLPEGVNQAKHASAAATQLRSEPSSDEQGGRRRVLLLSGSSQANGPQLLEASGTVIKPTRCSDTPQNANVKDDGAPTGTGR